MSTMRFTVPRDIYFGKGSLDQLKHMTGNKAVIVTGGSSMKKGGFLDRAAGYLAEAGLETAIFEGVESDPSIETVLKGKEFMIKEKPDLIVAIGGGSAIDAAKIMWTFYEHPELKFEDITEPFTIPCLRSKARMIAVPSTSGTAAEVTAFAVITDTGEEIKYPLADYNITPDIAILDPTLAETMPMSLTANTGMDALTHAIEAYVASQASDFSDGLALHAIKIIFTNLVKSHDGDKEAAERMHYAQCIAGMAFSNALLGITHSLAHKTGAALGIPHGLANAMYLPYVIKYNAEDAGAKSRYAEIARYVGIEEKEEDVLVEKLTEFIVALSNAMNLPTSLKQYGTDEMVFRRKIPAIAENAEKDPCTASNPRAAGASELKELLNKIYEGML